jgi:hypothetical protein
MTRWLVQLNGSSIDLEELPYWFPDGEVHGLAEGKEVFLVGAAFETLTDPGHVRDRAAQALDEFSAMISLLWGGFIRPELGNVFRERDDGIRQGFAALAGTSRGRSKARATLSSGTNRATTPTQVQTLLMASQVDDHLRGAVLLWADPTRTWPRLYRVLEEVELFLEQTVSKAKLCSAGERERFTRSANTAEVAGKDARHASGKFPPPKNPMTLAEATALVASLLQAALRQAATAGSAV